MIWRFASATAACACRYCSSRTSARSLFAWIVRFELLRLRGLGGEIALRRGAGGAGDRRHAEGQTERKAQGQVPGTENPGTAVGHIPPRHEGRP